MDNSDLIQVNITGEKTISKQNLIDKFIVPPFSVLDTRQGYWQTKKRYWLGLGIRGEVGRMSTVIHCKMDGLNGLNEDAKYISIFDPVLCEIIYKWFCPKNGKILDPFAGGSVRGIVAAKIGFEYCGIELRDEQVEANREQAKKIGVNPEYIIGDSDEKLDTITNRFDFIFSCPPYYNLEIYSDKKGELSNLESYKRFLIKYESIIKKSLYLLKYNRFACFVVGNIRDRNGSYLNLVGDTINLFCKNEKVNLYNDIILVNVAGSLPMRIGKQFGSNRKVGKMHQNVLVFYKGSNMEDIKKLNFLV